MRFSYKLLNAVFSCFNSAGWLREQVWKQHFPLLAVPVCCSFPYWPAAGNSVLSCSCSGVRGSLTWTVNEWDYLWTCAINSRNGKAKGRYYYKTIYVVEICVYLFFHRALVNRKIHVGLFLKKRLPHLMSSVGCCFSLSMCALLLVCWKNMVMSKQENYVGKTWRFKKWWKSIGRWISLSGLRRFS